MKNGFIIAFTFLALGCGGVTEAEKDKKATTFGSDDFPRESKTLFGAWETVPVSGRSEFRLFFNRKNQIGVEMVCDPGVGDVRASALGSVRVDSNAFHILQGLSGSADDQKGIACSFMWTPFNSPYNIQDEILSITSPDGSGLRSMRRLW